ncbi:putative serine protease K12H4.7 [Tigriopus californicus]|nr:putative serine protease K12H4.7 [Tigriopus californicus]
MKPLLLAFGLATLISIIEAKKDGGEKQLPWKVVRFSSRLRSQVPSNIEGKPVPDDQWFPQNLDHFHPTDDRMWKQRYFVNDTFYKKGGPIFLMIGGEGEANPIWMVEGTWIDYAREMGALCFQLEHRFYGKSHPTTDMSVKNLAYLSSEQALGDLATFISGMNQARNLTGSKWIAFGGSYPGSLAAWLRLKYPHLIHGSVSTSGPLYAKADFFEYLQVVRQALKVTDPECGPALEDALQKVDVLSRHRTGWAMISKKFNLCTPFDSTKKHDMANFFENLVGNFEDVVQYNKDNRAFEGVANTNVTIKTLCDIMTGKTVEAKDTTSKFFHNLDGEFRTLKAKFDRRTDTEGLEDFFKSYLSEKIVEYNVQSSTLQRLASVNQFMLKITGQTCMDHEYKTMIDLLKQTNWESEAGVGGRQWLYQTCTEFGWYQSSDQPGHPYTPYFPIEFLEKQCTDIFGSKYDLALLQKGIDQTNIMYGGKDIQVSNVIFVHGSIDPWHAMGITKDISDQTKAIFIQGTAHCANMYPESPEDPPQLKMARTKIFGMIQDWLKA